MYIILDRMRESKYIFGFRLVNKTYKVLFEARR
jgi:hypothetical protein